MNKHARVDQAAIPFIDVAAQRRRLGRAIDDAIARVLAHCQFLNGPEVQHFEQQLSAFCGAKHAISCASGTDALLLVLMAKGVAAGDAVFCPSFTFAATAEVVALAGATPVFVDVQEETFNIDAESLERAIGTARQAGLKPKAVIPVDLFGLPADHDAIASVAAANKLFVLDDAAQAFGAFYNGRKLGTLGVATATSFFPSKPLSCYGDGGAVLTDDDVLAATIKSLRTHGEGVDKYDNVRIGMTARLDTIQAAVLLEKLKIFPAEISRARSHRNPLQRWPCGRCDRAACPGGLNFGLGAIYHPPQAEPARRTRGNASGAGHSNGNLLSKAPASPGGLSPFSCCRWRPAGDRASR